MAQSAIVMAARVAATELQPWAMLANGPPCTKAGTPSMDCTKFGSMASFRSAIRAPVAPNSLQVYAEPSRLRPTTKRSRRVRRSSSPSAKQIMAMSSEAAVMSKPVSVGIPLAGPPRPVTILRSMRSFTSRTRRQVISLRSTCP